MNDQYWYNGGPSGIFVRAGLRTLQFVLAIVVAGLYGADLAYSTAHHKQGGTNWIYAEVVAGLSAITCIIHCLVTIRRVLWCLWDWVLMVLWAAQTGVFATIYLSHSKSLDDSEGTSSPTRMKIGAWINLVNMLLWFATAILGLAWCCTTRKITRRMSMGTPEPYSELSQASDPNQEKSVESESQSGSNHQNEPFEPEPSHQKGLLELEDKKLRDHSLEKIESPPPRYNKV